MNRMFEYCLILTSLNLNNFDTSQVTDMSYMFNGCSSLISLDLSYFITSKVTQMIGMFFDCVYLEYINMNNFEETILDSASAMFQNIPENVVVCINTDNNRKIFSVLGGKRCYVLDCSNNWK